MARTEEEKVLQVPLVVVLGGKNYKIKPLVIKDSRSWRKKLAELLSSLPQYAKATTDKPDEFGNALNAIMVSMPDTICDLFFEYAKDLDRESIETEATDEEVANAFSQVVEVAFPLAQSMTKAMGKITQ